MEYEHIFKALNEALEMKTSLIEYYRKEVETLRAELQQHCSEDKKEG